MSYKWDCHKNGCGYSVIKDTKQGLGMARSNHLRKHGINTMVGKWG